MYFFISLFSLIIGLACTNLLATFFIHEYNIESTNPNRENIYILRQDSPMEEGELVTCFLSNNDITGGNSGSPVLNGNAELLGLAFDGNWEALSGDIIFEPEMQRTISVDIRYCLYVIDKIMKAPHVIEELQLVR